MQIYQSELYSSHCMLIIFHIVNPHLKRSIHNVLMSFHKVSEELHLVFLIRHLYQFFFLTFEFLSDRNFVFELLSCCFEFIVHIRVSDGVKNFVKKHLCSCAINFFNKKSFLLEVLVISGFFTP